MRNQRKAEGKGFIIDYSANPCLSSSAIRIGGATAELVMLNAVTRCICPLRGRRRWANKFVDWLWLMPSTAAKRKKIYSQLKIRLFLLLFFSKMIHFTDVTIDGYWSADSLLLANLCLSSIQWLLSFGGGIAVVRYKSVTLSGALEMLQFAYNQMLIDFAICLLYQTIATLSQGTNIGISLSQTGVDFTIKRLITSII